MYYYRSCKKKKMCSKCPKMMMNMNMMNMGMENMENIEGVENMENMENMQNIEGMKDMEDDDRDLEALYPETYFRILPAIQKHCDDMEAKHGEEHTPDKEEIAEMIEKIFKDVEHDIEKMSRDYEEKKYYRQLAPFPGLLLRDMLGIALVGELGGRRRRRRRRRPPYPPYPYHRPPYYPGYPPYPGFGPYPGY